MDFVVLGGLAFGLANREEDGNFSKMRERKEGRRKEGGGRMEGNGLARSVGRSVRGLS